MLEEIKLPEDKNININYFSRILKESLTNSYKIFWFKAIYQNIINNKNKWIYKITETKYSYKFLNRGCNLLKLN